MSTQSEPQFTVERTEDFLRAWSSGNVERIMSFFTDEPVMFASAGSEPHGGGACHGYDEVRAAAESFVEHFPTANYEGQRIAVGPDEGFVTWRFEGVTKDGTTVSYDGCDVLLFEGDRIAVKSGYRKINV